MTDPEYIDSFFKKELPAEATRQFEQRIESDPAFAEDAAFYVSAMQTIKEQSTEQKKQRFREIYNESKYHHNNVIRMPQTRWWPKLAVAAVIAFLLVGSYWYLKPVSPSQLATTYLKEELTQLQVEMDNREDSMKTGSRLYNQKEYSASLKVFENLAQSDSSNTEAKEFAGIVSLQMEQYDKALKYFEALENYPGLQINPGKFYKAVTLMKRNHPGDNALAKQLLTEVDRQGLAGKEKAKEWLKKF